MIFYIRVPKDAVEKQKLNALLTGLEGYFGVETYNAVAVKAGAQHLKEVLRIVAEHERYEEHELAALSHTSGGLASSRKIEASADIRKNWSELDQDGKEKKCVVCGGPNERRSDFCSGACYQRARNRKLKENAVEAEG